MKNVWASIACQAPRATRKTRAQPLLHLFNGHSRSIRTQCNENRYINPLLRSTQQKPGNVTQVSVIRSFSNSDWLGAKSKRSSKETTSSNAARPGKTISTKKNHVSTPLPVSPSTPDGLPKSTLQPAQAVASHTEGIVNPSTSEDTALTWRDYDPEGGMPLPNGELSAKEVTAVFGEEKLDSDKANYILSVMYWRRMSGALIDTGFDFPKASEVSREQAWRGLEYVRSLNPDFDEQGAGSVWAEEETHRLREEMMERSMKLGIYKREVEIDDEEDLEQGTAYGRERSSQSALQRLREENEAKWEKEQAERKATKEREELAALHAQRGPLDLSGGVQPRQRGAGGVITAAQTKASLAAVKRKETMKYYEDQAMIIKDNTIPQMSVLQRLGPAALLMLVTLAGCALFAGIYDPPPTSARMFPDTPPAVATVTALTALLVVGFIGGRIRPLWRTFNKYFTIVPAYPYAVSLVGATWRHDTFGHLASNLIALWAFGLFLHEDVGRGTFLALFIGSGAVGGFAGLAYNVVRQQWATYIFGCSGAVLGVVAAACTLRPNGTVKMFGYELPVAAWLLLALYTSAEAFAAVRGMKTSIDHAGHLGGVIAGFAGAMYLRQQSQARNQQEQRPVVGISTN